MSSTTMQQQRRPSAASSAAVQADPLRSRRTASGSGSSTTTSSARINRVSTSSTTAGAGAGATNISRVTSVGAVPARLRDGFTPGSKANVLSASSPSPTRKVRDPLRPVPALPPLPALPTTTASASSDAVPSSADSNEGRRGAIRGLPGTKKRPVPDSFDARNGIPGLEINALNAAKEKTTEVSAPATKSEFHIGTSATSTATSLAARVKSRGVASLDAGRARSGSGATASSHMDAEELKAQQSPYSSRQTSPLPSEPVQEGPRASERRPLLGAVVAVSDDGEPELRPRTRPVLDLSERNGGIRSRIEDREDSSSPHDLRPLRPALKKAESTSPTNGPPIGGVVVPALSRSSSTRSESPSVRTPLESIPETTATHRRHGSDRGYNSDRDERISSAPLRPREGGDAFARISPTRTTRFAPLPPSHVEERVFVDRDRAALRRGRASGDYDRDDGHRVNPLTRSMTSFDDLRTPSAPQRTDSFTKLTSLHGPSPLHSTPAPPSRSATSACMVCGQHPEKSTRFSEHARQQPESAANPPSLTKADLDDAIARVTDIFEARIAEIQLDVFRSARHSRNAIVDELRALNCAEEGMSEELELLREENRLLRARLHSPV